MNTGRSDASGKILVLPSTALVADAQKLSGDWTQEYSATWGVTVDPAPQLVPERDQDHPLGLYAPFIMTLLLLVPQVDPALPRAWARLAAAGEQDVRRVTTALHEAATSCGRARYLEALECAAAATCGQLIWWWTSEERSEVERHLRLMFGNVLVAWTLFDVLPRDLFVRATGLFIGVATLYGTEDEHAVEASEVLAQQLNTLPEQSLREALPALQAREPELEKAVDRLTYDCYSSGHQDRWEGSDITPQLAEAEPLLELLHHGYVASVGREAQADAQLVRELLATLLDGAQ